MDGIPLKYLATVSARIGWHGLSTNDYREDGDYLVPGTAFSDGSIDWSGCQRVSREIWARDPMIQLATGDVLVTKDGTIGKVSFVSEMPGDATLNSGVFRIRASGRVEARFLYWVFQSQLMEDFIDFLRQGSTIDHLYQKSLVGFRIPAVSLTNQRLVAQYLDSATAAIDRTVALRHRQLEVLAARRQAVIDSRMTPRPDERWDEVPVKRLIHRIEQGWSPQCEARQADANEWGVLKAGAANGGRFRPDENKALPADVAPIPGFEIQRGDLLVSRANTRSLVASVCVVPEVRPRLLLCDKLFRLVPKASIDPRFLAYALRTTRARSEIEGQATGTSDTMLNVGQDTIRGLRILIPPEGQSRVSDQLDAALEHLDGLVKSIEGQVDLLAERREALITAAVTGQLSIPGVAA